MEISKDAKNLKVGESFHFSCESDVYTVTHVNYRPAESPLVGLTLMTRSGASFHTAKPGLTSVVMVS